MDQEVNQNTAEVVENPEEALRANKMEEESIDLSTKELVRKSFNKNIAIYEEDPIKMRGLRESLKNYLLLKKNIYLNRVRKTPTEDDIVIWEWVSSLNVSQKKIQDQNLSADWGQRWMNSIISIECDPSVWPWGELCDNRKFQRHKNKWVIPFHFGDKGFGLVAGEDIPKESFIIQYIGEVLSINSEEGKKRFQENSKSTCTYMMKLTSKEVIDPSLKGNMARFINHSWDPNWETRKWNVRGEIEVGIFAVKDIKDGEELTFDYKFDAYQTPFTRWLWGTSKCKGYLGLIPVEYTLEEWEEKIDNLPCEIWGSTSESEDNQLLLCDIWNNGYHTKCIDPPLSSVPNGAWFWKKWQHGDTATESLLNKNDTDEKDIQPSKKVEVDKPLKMLLRSDTRLRNYYQRNLKKQVHKNEGQDDEYLKEYNEFFAFQKQIQMDNIREFIEEMKQEKKAEIRAMRIGQRDESGSVVGEDIISKAQAELDKEYDDDDDDEETVSELDILEKKNKVNEQPQQNKTVDQKIKFEINQYFNDYLKKDEIWAKLKSKAYLKELNQSDDTSRKIMMISSIELYLFRISV